MNIRSKCLAFFPQKWSNIQWMLLIGTQIIVQKIKCYWCKLQSRPLAIYTKGGGRGNLSAFSEHLSFYKLFLILYSHDRRCHALRKISFWQSSNKPIGASRSAKLTFHAMENKSWCMKERINDATKWAI